MMRHFVVGVAFAALMDLTLGPLPTRVQAGEPAPPELSKLIRELKEGDAKAQSKAMHELLKLGPAAAPAVPTLVELALKTDARGYDAVLKKIGKPVVPILVPHFNHKDVQVRLWALNVVRGVVEEDIRKRAPHRVKGRIQERDLKAVRDLRAEWKPTAVAFAKQLDSDNAAIRRAAVSGLVFMGILVDPDVVPSLVKALDGPDTTVAKEAARVLRNLGSDAKSAIPSLIKALERGDDLFRYEVARSLATMGADAKDAVPALVRSLSKPEVNLSAHNLALLYIGAPSVPPLVQALTAEDEHLRHGAHQALRLIGLHDPVKLKEAVPDLRPLLRHKDPVLRFRACELLANVAPHNADAITAIGEAVSDPEGKVKSMAIYGLARLGPKAETAVPALIKGARDPEGVIRLNACMALGRVGPPAKSAVPVLIEIHRNDVSEQIRGQAADALRRIDPIAAREAGIRE